MAEATHQPARRSPPITRHPLFRATVALWFAALLALGSFALRLSLIEALVIAARVDSLFPAASPPLGVTARLLVAVIFGMTGAAIGWALAAGMARAPDAPAASVFKVADADLDGPRADPDQFPSVPVPMPDPVAHPVEAEIAPETPAASPADTPPTAAQRIASADLAELSHVELIERLAIALQRRQEWQAAPVVRAEDERPAIPLPSLAGLRSARVALAAPAPSLPSPVETEKALRDALAQLQRMRGAA